MMQADEKADRPWSPERRRALKALAGTAAVAVLGGGGWLVARRGRDVFEVRRERSLMQTSVVVSCLAADAAACGTAIEAAYARMAAATRVLTRFDPAGPVARLNRDGHLDQPPAMLREVLQQAQAVSARTDGDFDISVLPVLRYFESLRQPAGLDAALRARIHQRDHLVGYRGIMLDAQGVRFARPGMAITLDGLAKGYVIDQGIAALRAYGIGDALIDAGGDVRAISSGRIAHRWRVGIVDPADIGCIAAVVELRNAALGTSGNYRIFYDADKTLFHVIDPHTGYSPLHYASVTVMAETSVAADALSVAAASMPLPRLRETMRGWNAQWLVFDRANRRAWRSPLLPQVAGSAEVA